MSYISSPQPFIWKGRVVASSTLLGRFVSARNGQSNCRFARSTTYTRPTDVSLPPVYPGQDKIRIHWRFKRTVFSLSIRGIFACKSVCQSSIFLYLGDLRYSIPLVLENFLLFEAKVKFQETTKYGNCNLRPFSCRIFRLAEIKLLNFAYLDSLLQKKISVGLNY